MNPSSMVLVTIQLYWIFTWCNDKSLWPGAGFDLFFSFLIANTTGGGFPPESNRSGFETGTKETKAIKPFPGCPLGYARRTRFWKFCYSILIWKYNPIFAKSYVRYRISILSFFFFFVFLLLLMREKRLIKLVGINCWLLIWGNTDFVILVNCLRNTLLR